MIASFCNIEIFCTGGDPNFFGSMVIAVGLALIVFALVAIFALGGIARFISIAIAVVILAWTWSLVLTA